MKDFKRNKRYLYKKGIRNKRSLSVNANFLNRIANRNVVIDNAPMSLVTLSSNIQGKKLEIIKVDVRSATKNTDSIHSAKVPVYSIDIVNSVTKKTSNIKLSPTEYNIVKSLAGIQRKVKPKSPRTPSKPDKSSNDSKESKGGKNN